MPDPQTATPLQKDPDAASQGSAANDYLNTLATQDGTDLRFPPPPPPAGQVPGIDWQAAGQATLTPTAGAPAPPAIPGYEILGVLGRGGMGVVYKARHLKLQRLVALKMILAGGHASGEQLSRFRTEAEAVARLQHPNVVQIHEVGELDGLPFFSLEFVEGGSLADRLDGTPWLPRQAAQLVETLARAVHVAHQNGIVHRDLKPANVLLTVDGVPKITDFGLAKKLDATAGPTGTGDVMGTPSYMAPEQAGQHSQPIGPATDVYALGTILYELLTGRPPFKGATPVDTVFQVVHEEPVPPRRLQPKLPRDLETVCLKCLQKEPHKRYASAEALADDLRRFLQDLPIQARPAGKLERLGRWCRRNPRVASLLTFLAVLVVGGSTAVTCLWLVAEDRRRLAETNQELASQAKAKAEKNYRHALKAVDDYCTKVAADPRLREKDLEPLRKELLQTAVLFYQKFVEERSDDREVRAELGRAYARLASLTAAIDDKAKAVDFYRQALTLWEELGRENPAEPSYQDRQAFCHHHLALLYRGSPKLGDAKKSHDLAVGIQETLVRDYPAVADYQQALALSHNSLGNLYRRSKQWAPAEKAYKKALKILQDLTGKHPAVPDYQFNLATTQSNLGIVYRRTDQPGKAEEAYLAAIRIVEQMAPGASGAAEYQHQLTGSYINLGNVYNDGGHTDKAVEAFKKAVELAERLARGHPAITEYQSHLATTYNGLAIAYCGAAQTHDAEAAYERALEIMGPLTQKHPMVSDYAVTLGGIYCNLGDLARETNKFQKALDWFGRAIGTLKAVLRDEPKNDAARRFLRNAHGNRGLLWSAQENHAEAMKDWDRALELEEADDMHSKRALTLAHQGFYARALEEVKPLKGNKSRPADSTLFNSARVYALLSAAALLDTQVPKAERDKLAEQYTGRALDLLAQARTAGFFKFPANLHDLKTVKDFDSIRPHAAFQELLVEAEKQAKPKGK
jgi:serine/threonine protein kinase